MCYGAVWILVIVHRLHKELSPPVGEPFRHIVEDFKTVLAHESFSWMMHRLLLHTAHLMPAVFLLRLLLSCNLILAYDRLKVEATVSLLAQS